MKRTLQILATTFVLAFAVPHPSLHACTNFLISKGASADGSTMITYSADSHEFYGALVHRPAGRHAPGTMHDVYEWDTGKHLGRIAQAEETHNVVGNMNAYQVAIGETTWGGRSELQDTEAIIDYGSLKYLALQRAKSAREAIRVMTDLVAEYGYYSTGESFSISDPEEVWILEMIGKGPGNTGAAWVARKVPDGYISAHANSARIRRFPLDDTENTLYASDVISFARDQGFFEGRDEEFSFAEAYDPPSFGGRRFCDARVWCMYRRAAESLDLPSDWVKGVEGAEPIPLWVKPDRPLTVADVMGFMRDHFEGTDLDMTRDIGAGPHALPYRWRPLTWTVGDDEYFNERAVSTQQTGFSFVAQSRSWLPDPIGGVLWFGVDDTASTVYFPAYCGITEAPHSYAFGTGSFHEVDWEAAFWVFNQVSNFAYLRYDDMIRDIQAVQREMESRFLAAQPEIDAAAVALYERAPRLATDYLTEYSGEAGNSVVRRWRELSEFLLYKYLDGNVKNELGEVTHPGYPESWYETVAASAGDDLLMLKLESEKTTELENKQQARVIADAILTLLDARGVGVDEETRAKITETEDAVRLEKWLVRAAAAESSGDVVDED